MKIFISYASTDLALFRIPDIATRLEKSPDIERVFYWDRDSTVQKSIVQYMEDAINASDVVLIVCTEESKQSGPVQQETDMAVYLNKRIVPMFRDINEVRISLRPKRGVKYDPKDFDRFFDDLYLVLTERLPTTPDEQAIAQFHGIPLMMDEYRTMKALEEQIGELLPPIEPFCLPLPASQKLHLEEYVFDIKKFETISRERAPTGFSAKNNHVTQLDLSTIEPLQMFPDAIESLSHLEALDLSGQKISILPELIGNLTKLEYLDLRGNNLKNFPEGLTRLKLLKQLLFSGNPILEKEKGLESRIKISPHNYRIIRPLLINKCQLDKDFKKVRIHFDPGSNTLDEAICTQCGCVISQEVLMQMITNHPRLAKDLIRAKSDSRHEPFGCRMVCPKCGSKEFYTFNTHD